MPVLSDVVVFFSSNVVLTPNYNFWVTPLQHSVGDISHFGHEVALLVKALRYKPEGCGFDSRWYRNISLTKSFLPYYGPWVDSVSNRNISWWVKAAGAWGWQRYHLHVPIVFKSVSLSLLDLCAYLHRDCFTYILHYIPHALTSHLVRNQA